MILAGGSPSRPYLSCYRTVFPQFGPRLRPSLDRGPVRPCRHVQLAAQLAVALQPELDLVPLEGFGVDGGPRRIEQIAILAGESEITPQCPCNMRHDRIERA